MSARLAVETVICLPNPFESRKTIQHAGATASAVGRVVRLHLR